MDCSPPGSSVQGIFQARILECDAISFSRWSSQRRDWTRNPAWAGGILTTEPPGKPFLNNDVIVQSQVVSDSLRPRGVLHTRSPVLHQRCYPTVSLLLLPERLGWPKSSVNFKLTIPHSSKLKVFLLDIRFSYQLQPIITWHFCICIYLNQKQYLNQLCMYFYFTWK